MADSAWDKKLKSFLKKTGEDFKRFGNDVREEAGKLMEDVKDPEKQKQLREGLKDFGVLARKTAEEVAQFAEVGVKKAEQVMNKASNKVAEFVVQPATARPPPGEEGPNPTATPVNPSPPAEMADPPPAATPPDPPAKTIGRRDAKRPDPKRPATKTIGRKP